MENELYTITNPQKEENKAEEEEVNTHLKKKSSELTIITYKDYEFPKPTPPSPKPLKRESVLKKEIKNFLSNFKEVLFCYTLLCASLLDLSILNLPYTIFGFILSFYLFDYKPSINNFKSIINWIFLSIVILNIVFKGVIAILFYTENAQDFMDNNTELLMSLGVRFMKNDTVANGLNTFFGDLIILIILILMRVFKSKDTDKSIFENISKMKFNFYSNFLLFSTIICVLVKTSINISFIGILFSCILYAGLIIWGCNRNLKTNKFFYMLILILMTMVVLVTHIVNIYYIRKTYQDNPAFKYLGILKMKIDPTYIIDYCLSVLVCILCIISVKLSSTYKLTPENLKRTISRRTTKLWMRIRDFIISYILSPYFILHFCRLAVLYLIYSYRNYPTIFLMFWFFYSCLIINAGKMKTVTYIIAWPALIYIVICFAVCNIPDFLYFKLEDSVYAFENLRNPKFEVGIVQITIFLFAILTKTLNKKQTQVVIEEKPKPAFQEVLLERKPSENNEEDADGNNTVNDINHKKNSVDEDEDSKTVTNKTIKDEETHVQEESISILDLFFKLVLTNVDKITLVFMYLIAIQKVNIAHASKNLFNLVLTGVFLIQLIFPRWIKNLIVCIIITIEVLFSFEYIWDIIRILTTLDKDTINIVHIFVDFDSAKLEDKSREMYLVFIIYCFYVQYTNYNSEIYKNYEDEKKVSLKTYLENLFENYPKLQSTINAIVYIIQELWVWITLILLFLCITSFNYYVLFSVKLVLFFLVMYKFLSEKVNSIMKFIWILIIYSAINTLAVYLFQFVQLNIIKDWYIESIYNQLPEWMAHNISAFGFEIYDHDVALKFLPHYGSNLLSVMLYWECRRLEEIKKNVKAENKAKKEKKNANDKIKLEISYAVYYLLNILVVVCKTYWLFIFLSLCAIILTYQLSVTILLYVFMFCLSFILMFRQMIMLIDSFKNRKTNFFFTRMLRYYVVEQQKHVKIQVIYRNKTFQYLVLSSMFYILLVYLYSLFDIVQNSIDKYPVFTTDVEDIIKSVSYIVGIYNKVADDTVFVYAIWGHMFLIILISFDLYVQKMQKILLEKIAKMNKLIRLKENLENKIKQDVQPIVKTSIKFSRAASIMSEFKDDVQSEQHKITVKAKPSSTSLQINNITDEYKEDLIFMKIVKVFRKIQLKKNEVRPLSPTNYKFTIQHASKKLLEEIIFFLILISAVIKVNIISILYLVYVLIFYIKGKNVHRIYYTTIFLCIMVTLQLLVFISNINPDTDPEKNLEILSLIRYYLGLPWYERYLNDGWSFYLSFGINNYQLVTLWGEFAVLILCFLYLDNFCYSLYDDNCTHISYYNIGSCVSIRKALVNITEQEYNEIRDNLMINYMIYLVNFSSFLHYMNLTTNQNGEYIRLPTRSFQDENLTKKTKTVMFLHSVKKIIYLTFQYYILIFTLILSMMNPGLISIVYIFFSLGFLYKSRNVLIGERFELLLAASSFLQGYLFFDLLLQLIYQSPINSYLDINDVLSAIGINIILDYVNPEYKINFVIDSNFMIMTCLKAIVLFLVSLLIVMYHSKSFKEYYVKYVLSKKSKVIRNGAMNTFQFNNKRIESMQRIVDYRKEVSSKLGDLEKQLENWEKKFNQDRNFKEEEDKYEYSNTFNEEMNENDIRNKIKQKLKERPLIRLAIVLNKVTSNYTFIHPNEKEEYETAIVKGETYIISKIEKKINEFVDSLDLKELSPDKVESVIDAVMKKNKTLYYTEIELEGNMDIEEEEEPLSTIRRDYDIKEYEIQDVIGVSEEAKKMEEEVPQDIPKIDSEKFKKLISGKLPSKHLSNCHVIYKIISYCFRYFHNNFELIVYFFMILNNMMNGNLISLVYPLIVFCYGLLSYPRSKNTFWKTIFIYASAVILFKFLIQLKLWKLFFPELVKYDKDKFRIGFKIFESSFSMDFFDYIIWDCLVLLLVMIKTYILINKGLWLKIEPEIETVEMAYDRINKAKVIPENKMKIYKEELIKSVALSNNPNGVKLNSHYQDLFPRIRVLLT
jgi:hypothetical protein